MDCDRRLNGGGIKWFGCASEPFNAPPAARRRAGRRRTFGKSRPVENMIDLHFTLSRARASLAREQPAQKEEASVSIWAGAAHAEAPRAAWRHKWAPANKRARCDAGAS